MTTKDIRTAHVQVACDICGRTLLRGERSDTYLSGGTRREVCELCTPRAVHAGWVREGLAPERGARPAPGERGRSLLGRLRRPRTDAEPGDADAPPLAPLVNGNGRRAQPEAPPEPRTPRQVRAVPTSIEQRTASAIEHFNQSEFPRTVAGVARSLGSPLVVARPSPQAGGVVTIVVSWELCWYRYEIDLSDGGPSVRAAGQGYELDELEQEDRAEPNAVADEYGTLAPA